MGTRLKGYRAIWSAVNGPIPKGYHIHHRNGNPRDNRIENLELVSPLTHKRIHTGCVLHEDRWWKPCEGCGKSKPIDAKHWHLSKAGYPARSQCRACWQDRGIVIRPRPKPTDKRPQPYHFKGAFARAAKLSPARRSEIARKAAKARWKKVRKARAA